MALLMQFYRKWIGKLTKGATGWHQLVQKKAVWSSCTLLSFTFE